MSDAVEVFVERLKGSFRYFLRELWKCVGLPEPSRVQYDVARYLEKGPRRRGIKGFRGLSKTWITAAYLLWRLMKNPDERVLLCSESLNHSRKTLHMMRSWMATVPFIMHLAPIPASRQRDSADNVDVGPSKWDRVASITAMGVRGQLAGGRGSIIVGDDIETLENSLTRDQRLLTRERVTEFENILLPGGDIIYLGTPHHDETIYDYLPSCGYVFSSWPARYPQPSLNITSLAPMYEEDIKSGKARPGDPVWPERFSVDELQEREAAQRSRFARQFMLVSSLADELKYPLKLSDMIVTAVNAHVAPDLIVWGQHNSRGSTAIQDIELPGHGGDRFYAPAMMSEVWRPYTCTKAFIDPAGLGDDEMAWAIVGQLHGFLWVKHVGAVKGGATSENLELIAESLRLNRVNDLYIETNFGGEMLIQLMKPILSRAFVKAGGKATQGTDTGAILPDGWACSVTGVHSVGQKEHRIINTLEPVLNQHRLAVDHSVARDSVLMYQLTHITHERGCLEHDDRVDALAGVVSQFADVLDQDANQQAARQTEEDYIARVNKWRGGALQRAANWLDRA